jgi:NAD(P)-dependent dehydrogenase (short-subunit alcohol dehydrogenase family)
MKGKTCVITGATSGIGRATAFGLAESGANLVLLGRNEARGRAVVSQINNRRLPGKVNFLRCDLTDSKEIGDTIRAIRETCESVEVLVNNAGARFNTFGVTPAGIERTFAGNYLGHFLLTALLLELLLNATSSRIIILGSSAHSVTPPADWNVNRGDYDRKRAYGISKLATIVWSYELARRLTGTNVTVNALDPGGVATRLGLNNGVLPWLKHLIYYLLKGQLLSAEHAAASIIDLAASPEIEGKSGGYYHKKHLIRSSTASYDPSIAAGLWHMSVAHLKLDAEAVGKPWGFIAP